MLNPKQRAFAQEYIKDWNATQAATRCGYSPKTARSQGQRLLTNADIQNEISRLSDELLGTEKASLRYLVLKLTKEIATKAKPELDDNGDSMLDDEGNPIMVYTATDRDRLKALEDLGRYSGMDNLTTQKIEVTVTDLSDAERARRIAELEAKRNGLK